jgi:hypothetical protein
MNTQLTHMIAQQRSAELQRAGARARLAREVRAGQPNPRHPKKKHLWVHAVSADLASGQGAAAGRGPWQSWMAVAAIYYPRGIAMLELVPADGTGPAYTDPTGEGLARQLALAVQGLTGRTAHIAQQ